MLSHQVIINPSKLNDVLENHSVEYANRLITEVKSFVIIALKVDWSGNVRNSTKLRTFIQFKPDHSLEDYLFYILCTRFIKALSRLRISSHSLEIERGRHVKPQKIPLEQRILLIDRQSRKSLTGRRTSAVQGKVK